MNRGDLYTDFGLMTISLHEIAVRDLADDYGDRGDEGVVGYGGRLDIRPRLAPRSAPAT